MDEDYHYNVPGVKICNECKSWVRLEVHHKDGNHKNNDASNLQWLCHNCHVRKHNRYIPEPDFGDDFRDEANFDFRFRR